ncbi:MAG TPA: class I SAM-dependent methyltransferase [Kineosporiaceae bacterium]
MRDYTSETYGDTIADDYDTTHPDGPDTAAAASFLAQLAGTGPALELGIGTGRIAIPLAARGVEVHGIDSSQRMIDRLKEKPGGDSITVSLSDMVEVEAPRDDYAVVFTTFNTFWMLLTQDEQIRCMRNAALRLADDGVLVIEGSIPDPAALAQTRSAAPYSLSATHATVEVNLRDPILQRIEKQIIMIDESGIRLRPLSLRYVWPSEQDLMARLAGMRLRKRVEDWAGAPITQRSLRCVAVYEKAAR